MREPQKILMLLALAYAILFGWGVERLSQVDISPTRFGAVATALCIGVVLPLGYCATIFDGLAGKSPLVLCHWPIKMPIRLWALVRETSSFFLGISYGVSLHQWACDCERGANGVPAKRDLWGQR